MKELSIEQKAQRYDNLIKRLKDFQSEYKFKTIDEYFPELKESEDERIRKRLIGVVELYYGNSCGLIIAGDALNHLREIEIIED